MDLLVAATKAASAVWGDEGRKAPVSKILLGLFPFLCESVGEHQPLGGCPFLGYLRQTEKPIGCIVVLKRVMASSEFCVCLCRTATEHI